MDNKKVKPCYHKVRFKSGKKYTRFKDPYHELNFPIQSISDHFIAQFGNLRRATRNPGILLASVNLINYGYGEADALCGLGGSEGAAT